MPDLFFHRDALPPAIRAAIHNLLIETGKRRPLTRVEIHLRCVTQTRPWSEAGIGRSTFYRRQRRERLSAAQFARAA